MSTSRCSQTITINPIINIISQPYRRFTDRSSRKNNSQTNVYFLVGQHVIIVGEKVKLCQSVMFFRTMISQSQILQLSNGNVPAEYGPFISHESVSVDTPSEKPVTILRDTVLNVRQCATLLFPV